MQTKEIQKIIEFVPDKEYVFLEDMKAMVSKDEEWGVFISFNDKTNDFSGLIMNLLDGTKHDVFGKPDIPLFVVSGPGLVNIQARARVAMKRLHRVLKKGLFPVPQFQY